MGLQDVVDAVRQDFADSGCPANVYLGQQFISDNAEPLEVVFVPTTDRFIGPKPMQAAGPYVAAKMGRGANPRPIFTRVVGADVNIWAGAARQNPGEQYTFDFLQLDALINQTALSLYRVGAVNNLPSQGSTNTEVSHTERGLLYVLKITIEIPIVDIDYPRVGIGPDSITWKTKDDVEADITTVLNPSTGT